MEFIHRSTLKYGAKIERAALRLDGATAHVSVDADAAKSGGAMTVEVLAKLDDLDVDGATLFETGNGAGMQQVTLHTVRRCRLNTSG